MPPELGHIRVLSTSHYLAISHHFNFILLASHAFKHISAILSSHLPDLKQLSTSNPFNLTLATFHHLSLAAHVRCCFAALGLSAGETAASMLDQVRYSSTSEEVCSIGKPEVFKLLGYNTPLRKLKGL